MRGPRVGLAYGVGLGDLDFGSLGFRIKDRRGCGTYMYDWSELEIARPLPVETCLVSPHWAQALDLIIMSKAQCTQAVCTLALQHV